MVARLEFLSATTGLREKIFFVCELFHVSSSTSHCVLFCVHLSHRFPGAFVIYRSPEVKLFSHFLCNSPSVGLIVSFHIQDLIFPGFSVTHAKNESAEPDQQLRYKKSTKWDARFDVSSPTSRSTSPFP